MARSLMSLKLVLGTALLLSTWAVVPSAVAAGKAVHAASAETASNQAAGTDSAMPVARAPSIDIPHMRDPFESYIDVLQKQRKARLQAFRSKKSNHATQPLESFDLGALKLVAVMRMGENRAAMVQDPEGKGYVIRPGSYIGRDNGRVVSISDKRVQILEDVVSPTGDLIKRKASLTLNEVNSQK